MTARLIKTFFAAAAVCFLSLYICKYVQAAVTLEDAVLENGILRISGSVDSLGIDPQLTLTITPLSDGSYDLNKIVYIGQQPIYGSIFTIEFPLTLDDGYYVARVGGSDIEKPRFILINRKGSEYKILFGDVDKTDI